MRVFIALLPDKIFLESLLDSIEPAKEKYSDLRWVPEENLHITLAFLGEINRENLSAITGAAEQTSAAVQTNFAQQTSAARREAAHGIHVTSQRLFTLPRNRPANVLAAGFDSGGEQISFLARGLVKKLNECGMLLNENEKNHLPHITVARKGRKEMLIAKDDLSIHAEGKVISLGVFESILSGRGAVYNLLASFPLITG